MPEPAKKPNILVIWGDDIGITNLSCYSDGLMGYRTPNIDRIADEDAVHRLVRRAELHGGAVVVHHRPERLPHRPEQGRRPRHGHRSPGRGRDDRRAAEAARLRDGAVRQEPPGRPEQVPPDRARLRRVLRQPLPPERGRGAGAAELAARRRLPHFRERFGPRGVIHSWATDEDDDTEEPRFGRVGGSGSRTPAR